MLGVAFLPRTAPALDVPPDSPPAGAGTSNPKTPFDLFVSRSGEALKEIDVPEDVKRELLDTYRKADAEITQLSKVPSAGVGANPMQRIVAVMQHVRAEETRLLTADQREDLRRRASMRRILQTLDRFESAFNKVDTAPQQKDEAAAILESARKDLARAGTVALGDVQRNLLSLLTDNQRRTARQGPLGAPPSVLDLATSTDPKDRQRLMRTSTQDFMLRVYESLLRRVNLSEEQQNRVEQILTAARNQSGAGQDVLEDVKAQLTAVLTEEQKQAKALDFLLRDGKALAPAPVAQPHERVYSGIVRVATVEKWSPNGKPWGWHVVFDVEVVSGIGAPSTEMAFQDTSLLRDYAVGELFESRTIYQGDKPVGGYIHHVTEWPFHADPEPPSTRPALTAGVSPPASQPDENRDQVQAGLVRITAIEPHRANGKWVGVHYRFKIEKITEKAPDTDMWSSDPRALDTFSMGELYSYRLARREGRSIHFDIVHVTRAGPATIPGRGTTPPDPPATERNAATQPVEWNIDSRSRSPSSPTKSTTGRPPSK